MRGWRFEELENHFDLEIEERDFETVGGFIIHFWVGCPKPGKKSITGTSKSPVLDADSRRIRRLRIEKMPEEPPEPFLG